MTFQGGIRHETTSPSETPMATACVQGSVVNSRSFGKENQQLLEEVAVCPQNILLYRLVQFREEASAASDVSHGGVAAVC